MHLQKPLSALWPTPFDPSSTFITASDAPTPPLVLQPTLKVHCVCPGTITSPGFENENKTKHAVTLVLEEGDLKQTEDEVAAAAVKGLESGGYLVTTQLVGHAMRASMLGGSPRNNALVDTLFGWATYVAWLFVGPDLEGKVFEYGKKNHVKLPQ